MVVRPPTPVVVAIPQVGGAPAFGLLGVATPQWDPSSRAGVDASCLGPGWFDVAALQPLVVAPSSDIPVGMGFVALVAPVAVCSYSFREVGAGACRHAALATSGIVL